MKRKEQVRLLAEADKEHRRRLAGLYTKSARDHEVRCYNEAVVKLNGQPKKDRTRYWHVFRESTVRHVWEIVYVIFTSLIVWLIITWLQNR